MKLFSSTKNITFMGIMLGMTIVFVAVTAIPTASASMALFIFIPTIITGIILGPIAGALMGFLAGFSTLTRALLAPLSPIDLLFINPFISILPRVFIGIASYYVYTFLNSIISNTIIRDKISPFLAGAFGAITNTALVMTMLYIFYAKELVKLIDAPFKKILLSVITTNGILEAAVAGIFTFSIVSIYIKINK